MFDSSDAYPARALAERRLAPRFPLRLAVAFEGGQGATRDISASGVFLSTRSAFSPGAPIKLVLELEHAELTGVLCVACEGRVVRVEPGPDELGVAASLTSIEFRRPESTNTLSPSTCPPLEAIANHVTG